MTDVLFAEHTVRSLVTVHPVDGVKRTATRVLGACLEHTAVDGYGEHRFADNSEVLPPQAAVALDHVRDTAPCGVDAERQRELVELVDAHGIGVQVAVRHQYVLAGPPTAPVADERRFASIEASLASPVGVLSEVRPWPAPAGNTVAETVAQLADELRARAALPWRYPDPAVLSHCDIVLAPGRAGAFFHELLGHPLEADVLTTGTSWLSGREGDRVGPDWLTVTDGVRTPADGYYGAIDDEGTASSTAVLLDRGRVGEPMTDLASSTHLNRRATGHGRRLDYRHPAIPRMTHTCAEIAPGTHAEHATGHSLAPFGLRLESMNVADGTFVFRAAASLWTGPDGVVHHVGPLELSGDAATVLGSLTPVDLGVRAYARANRGCGKLGQFPLPVSFGNPGVRLPAGAVALRTVGRG